MEKAVINLDSVKILMIELIKEGNVENVQSGKSLFDLCNLTDDSFFVRTKRLLPSTDYVQSLNDGLHKGYCAVEIVSDSRVFNKNIDFAAVDITLTFWVQTEALAYLDLLIERSRLAVLGERYALDSTFVDSDGNIVKRSAEISIGNLRTNEILSNSPIGESAICQCAITMNINANLAIDSDTSLDLTLKVSDEAEPTLFENVHATAKNIVATASTNALTQTNLAELGNIKTALIKSISFSCYCEISNLGKGLERLLKNTVSNINETIGIRIKLPNGTMLENDMICTDAKISIDQTSPVTMSFVFNLPAEVSE